MTQLTAINPDSTSAFMASLATVTTVTDLTSTIFAEPGQGIPPATTTLANKLAYVYKAFRNQVTQTSSTYSLYNDAASVVDQKATVSDNGTTFTRTNVVSGP